MPLTGPDDGGQALTHGSGIRRPRLGWLAGLATLALSLAQPGWAADLLVTSHLYVPGLREQVRAWSQETGHRVTWLLPDEVEGQWVADVLVLPSHAARIPADTGQFKALSPPVGGAAAGLASLLASPWRQAGVSEPAWLALPLPTRLPMLYVAGGLLQNRGLSVTGELGWPAIVQLASELTDPIGEIHGICIDPIYPHAMVVRSMLADAGAPWLEPASGQPYAGTDWLAWAQEYSRLLAASGFPNAASMTSEEFAALLAANKCAMWLAPRQPDRDSGTSIAVPGAAAFISDGAPVVAVLASSERLSLASEFAWWLVLLERAEATRYAGVRIDALPDRVGHDRQPVLQMLRQRGQQGAWPMGWSVADQAGQLPLQRLVDGLLLPEDALAEAQAGLALAAAR